MGLADIRTGFADTGLAGRTRIAIRPRAEASENDAGLGINERSWGGAPPTGLETAGISRSKATVGIVTHGGNRPCLTLTRFPTADS
jgi:hypothetical protein